MEVKGVINVGGFAGSLRDSSPSYNTSASAHLIGDKAVGGLVGEIGVGSFIEESFASSYFSGGSSSAYFTGEFIGGLVGVIKVNAREDCSEI